MFSKEEERWIKRLQKCFKDKPINLIAYLPDDILIICKRGYSSIHCNKHVECIIKPTTMLTDIHDSMNNGDY